MFDPHNPRSLEQPIDPPEPRPREACPYCVDGRTVCDECYGAGFFDVDGRRVTCTNRGCVDGKVPCGRCDW